MFLSNVSRKIPTRASIWLMLFTATFFLYMIRINLSIIILGMVEPSRDSNKTIAIPECAASNKDYINSNNNNTFESAAIDNNNILFNWDSKLQGLILGAYFWGFIISAIPGGALAEKFGPTKVVAISFVVSGVLTLLGPLASTWHPTALIVSRFFIGLFGGVVYPAVHCLIARWSPSHERSRFVAALLGNSLGTVSTWPALGSTVSALGWQWGFYVCGIAVLVWTAIWIIIVSDSPTLHPRISEEEVKYILDGQPPVGLGLHKKFLPPYKSIFFSLPMWGLIILHFGNLWGLFFLMTAGPNFMSTVLGFNLGHTGFLAALPYLARFTFGLAFSQIGDFVMKKKLLEKTASRKVFVIFSHFIPGLLLFIQTLLGCEIPWTIALITLSLGSNGASTITNLQNSQDLSPNFAGTLYGIANSIGSTTGFITPLIVGYMTQERNGIDEWRKIFYIGASVYILCGVIFCLIGSGEIQTWNEDNKTEKDGEKNGIENVAYEKSTEELTIK